MIISNFISLQRNRPANPKQLIELFFSKYAIEHVRRELADWLEAGIDYESSIPGGIAKRHIFSTHKDISCLVEAAYYLIQ